VTVTGRKIPLPSAAMSPSATRVHLTLSQTAFSIEAASLCGQIQLAVFSSFLDVFPG